MTKLTVQFNYNSKTYDFITDIEDINIDDIVCVKSPVSESGFGIARVVDIEENTNDLEHSSILSKIRYGNEVPKEILERKEYVNGHLLVKDEQMYFMNGRNRTNDLPKNMNYMIDYDVESLIIRPIFKKTYFYELVLVETPNERCIEIDTNETIFYIEVIKYKLDEELIITDWKTFEFDYDNQYCKLPKELVKIELDDIGELFDESIDYFMETVGDPLYYRIKDRVEDILGCYFDEFGGCYNVSGSNSTLEMCNNLSLSSKKIRETMLSNIDDWDRERIAAYTVELIAVVPAKVPEKYKYMEHLLQRTYLNFANVELFAKQHTTEVWYDNDDYDTEPIEFEYPIYAVIDCNPTYK